MEKIHFPDGLSYECSSCGKCCRRNWRIEVESENIKMIEDFARKKGIEKSLVRCRGISSPILNMRSGRGCVFLDENNRCLIHGVAKPLMCRVFPMKPVKTPDGYYVRISFACNSVRKNSGKSVNAYSSDVEGYVREGFVTGEIQYPVIFHRGIAIGSADLEYLNKNVVLKTLADRGPGKDYFMEIWLRLWHIFFLASMEGKSNIGTEIIAKSSVTDYDIKSFLRPPLVKKNLYYALFVGYELVGREEKSGPIKIKNLINLVRNKGIIVSKYGMLDLKKIGGVRYDPTAESEALLKRYFWHIVESNWMLIPPKDGMWIPTVINSWALLGLFYGLIVWFSKMFAHVNGRVAVSHEDVDRALEVVEIEYVSHISRTWLFLDKPVFAKIFEFLSDNPNFLPIVLS